MTFTVHGPDGFEKAPLLYLEKKSNQLYQSTWPEFQSSRSLGRLLAGSAGDEVASTQAMREVLMAPGSAAGGDRCSRAMMRSKKPPSSRACSNVRYRANQQSTPEVQR